VSETTNLNSEQSAPAKPKAPRLKLSKEIRDHQKELWAKAAPKPPQSPEGCDASALEVIASDGTTHWKAPLVEGLKGPAAIRIASGPHQGKAAILLARLLSNADPGHELAVHSCDGEAAVLQIEEIMQAPNRYAFIQNSSGTLKLIDLKNPETRRLARDVIALKLRIPKP
jgi:hypothetical protein